MKNIAIIITLFFTSFVIAQQKPKNVSEETETKTVKVNDGKKVVEKKIKVTTREEQELKLAEKDKNKVNQKLVESPVKVTKTVQYDNDNDPYYDVEYQQRTFKYNGNEYAFTKDDTGFVIIDSSNKGTPFANIYRSSTDNHYIFESKNRSGIGYFDAQGNFILEYYDGKSKVLKKRVYVLELEDKS